MKTVLRDANVSDVPQLLALVKELAHFEKAPNEVSNTESQMLQDGFGRQPLFKAFVAEINSNIIGMAIVYFRYSTWKGKCLYLEDLYVQPEHRRSGVGKLLFNRCLAYAKEENCVRMSWQVLEWNTDAIDFYKNYGTLIDEEWLNCSLPTGV